MISDGCFTYRQIGAAANCSFDAVKAIRRNLRGFGRTKALRNHGGRYPSVTPLMREALLEYLVEKPDLTPEEMVVYLWDDFESRATTLSISRALHTAGWSKEKARGISWDLQRSKCRSTRFLPSQHFSSPLPPSRIR